MTQVTVCVPAYRAAAFIAQTLGSIRSQTFGDVRVEIAVEPDGAAATVDACAPFLDDPRFRLRVNDATLGWDGNVRALMRRVETPYFVVLPHDDLWHPLYLEVLMGAIHDRPDATVAFADTYLFGEAAGVRSFDLPDAGLEERLLAFFLGGAEGMPWRGLTRSDVLDEEFPRNPFAGFAVECEWTMRLVLRGVALRVARPLYLKRDRGDGESVATAWRFSLPETTLRSALDHHRSRLLDLLARSDLPDGARGRIEHAAEAAMLLRWVQFSRGRFEPDEHGRRRIDELIRAVAEDATTVGRQVRTRVHLALSRHALHHGDEVEALRQAELATRDAPASGDAALHLARLLLRAGRTLEALPLIHEASIHAPMAVGLRDAEVGCARGFRAMFPYEPVRDDRSPQSPHGRGAG